MPRRFRHATMEDYPQVMRNYEYARELMARNGNPTQWGHTFPRPEVVTDDITQRRLMLLVDQPEPGSGHSGAVQAGGVQSGSVQAGSVQSGNSAGERILAQFALCTGEDPTYQRIEGAWLDDASYVTLHRVASSGLVRHAARDCIMWALTHYGNVRADTHPNNKAMQHVLETSGFARCGLIQLLDREEDTTRIAYQRHEW